jgi:hypothetical protein
MWRELNCSLFVLLTACNSGDAAGGSASVSGTVAGNPITAKDVVAIIGTQQGDGGVQSSYAVILISDTAGTCAAAQQGGVSGAVSRASVLEVAAVSGTAAFVPGVYSVGSAGLAEYFSTKPGTPSGTAGSGKVTFDAVNASTVSGSLDLNLAGGQHVTGTFSGAVCTGVPSTPTPW